MDWPILPGFYGYACRAIETMRWRCYGRPPGEAIMSPLNVFQFVAATAIFMIAAVSAKSWALSPNLAKTIITLVLYTLGNILMMRLVRSVGMSTAFSLSAVLQLIAINIIA